MTRIRMKNRGLCGRKLVNNSQLTVEVNNGEIMASFKPEKPLSSPLNLNMTWLGFDLETKIKGGENEGKTLKHDFVSYGTHAIKANSDGATYYWRFTMDKSLSKLLTKKGAAFWITAENNPTPIQATGGWL